MTSELLLFGGSFDPVHLGHLRGAQRAREVSGAEQVVFLPCQRSPHKERGPFAAGEQRLAMLELALQGSQWAVLDDRELSQQGPSPTWKTIESFQQQYPSSSLSWLLGSDQWEVIESWAKPDFLAKHLHFYVLERQGKVRAKKGWNSTAVPFEQKISSTAIRGVLKDDHSPEVLNEMLDPGVQSYLAQHRVYVES